MKKALIALGIVILVLGALYARDVRNVKADIYGSSLVGWWTLDSGAATDYSGHGNTGTLAGGPTAVQGKLAQAIFINGGNQYVSAPNSSSLDIPTNGSVTMCAWVNLTAYPSAGDDFAEIVAKRSGATYAYGINFRTVGGNWFQVFTQGSSGIQNFTTYVLPLGKWTHVCGVISGSPTALYINGQLYGTLGTGGGVLSTSDPLAIGNIVDNSEPFTGAIDDVRVYNRALTASDVAQLYYMGASNHGEAF